MRKKKQYITPKPGWMSQSEYDRNIKLAAEAHRIYMATLSVYFEELAMLENEDKYEVALFSASMMVEHLFRELGEKRVNERVRSMQIFRNSCVTK